MDFFSQQDQARKRTSHLVLLFLVALTVLTVLVNLVVAAALWGIDEHTVGQYQNVTAAAERGYMADTLGLFAYISWQQWLAISAAVVAVVGGASLFKWLSLKGGGQRVAEMLGGRLAATNTDNFYQRRLLNVVEEMAIAAGMPVPPVYILPDDSINAFAAGYQPSDAVIGVTRGAIEKLSREQLQGVIAHEFSHILNGDMRLNIRLMAILFGILFIGLIGRFVLDSALHSRSRSSKENNTLPLWAVGIALIVIGYSGVFFGNLIKAAVSRQREFLADASAVQFTRNPEGIAEALKVIGHGSGSEISSSEREETAHLFFGQAVPWRFGWFHTHPPLEERIRRLDKQWDGRFLPPQSPEAATAADPELAQSSNLAETVGMVAAAVVAANTSAGSQASSADVTEPESPTTTPAQTPSTALQDAARDPYTARALIYSLLLAAPTAKEYEQQLELVRQHQGQDLYRWLLRLHQAAQALPRQHHLPLVETAIPALKQLSASQYQAFRTTLVKLAKADGSIDIFEWCLYRLILQYLEPVHGDVSPVKARYGRIDKIKESTAVVLSYLAHYGHDNEQAVQHAFAQGCQAAGVELSLQPKPTQLNPLNQALVQLQQAYPHVKARIIKALVACAEADQQLLDVELDLVRTLAALLETPAPELIPAGKS